MKNAKEFLQEKYTWLKNPDIANNEILDYTFDQLCELLEEYDKFKPKKEVKRYFLASYQGFYKYGSIRGGNVHFDCNTYPPRWWIEDKIKELDPGIYRAMILTIQEMTKEDYESFVSKEN